MTDNNGNGWSKHEKAVYQFHDATNKKFDKLDKTNEKQFDMLGTINKSIGDMHGDLKVFKFKIAGLSAVVSTIIAFLSRHLG